MSARGYIAWAVVVMAALAGPAVAWRALGAAQTSADAELRRLGSIRDKAGELRALRAAHSGPTAGAAGRGALAARVSRALASAGVPASALASFSPQSQPVSHAPGGVLSRHSAAVVLAPITLPRLGSFLAAWRAAEPGWTISSIEVSPESAPAGAAPGADLPLRASMIFESVSVEDPGAPS